MSATGRRLFAAASFVSASFVSICIALPASAQETVRIRGTVERIDGPVYVVKNRDGAEVKLTLTDNPLFVVIVPSRMSDIKQGMFVGSAGMNRLTASRKPLRFTFFRNPCVAPARAITTGT